jgi:hypothetical protein
LSAGAFTTPKGSLGSYPSNNTSLPNAAYGLFAGRGPGVFVTNAGNVATLSGPFSTFILAAPPIGWFPGAALEIDYSGGVGVVSASIGDAGAGIMTLQTNTFKTTSKPCPQ